jgi:hypothetical protein
VSQVHDGYIACGFSFPHVLAHFLKPLFHTYVDEEEKEGGREGNEGRGKKGGLLLVKYFEKGRGEGEGWGICKGMESLLRRR